MSPGQLSPLWTRAEHPATLLGREAAPRLPSDSKLSLKIENFWQVGQPFVTSFFFFLAAQTTKYSLAELAFPQLSTVHHHFELRPTFPLISLLLSYFSHTQSQGLSDLAHDQSPHSTLSLWI